MRIVVFLFLLITHHLLLIPFTFAHSAAQVIKMTPSGFEPQTITLDTNSTVIFINEDQVDRWPASDFHPTHTEYSEFDPKRAIKVSESWLFKPTKVGTFKFHDHLNPHLRGTLVVEVEKETTSTQETSKKTSILQDWIFKIQNIFSSFKWPFSTISKKEDASLIWQQLVKNNQGMSGNSGNIHDQAHLIGGQIYEQTGLPGLSKCSPDFAFGCFHGFLDKAFQKSLDGLIDAEKACLELGIGGPSASCIHGIGHGVASFYQTNNIREALKSCQNLSENTQQYCFDGVFMEFERAAPATFYSQDNLYKPCDELIGEFGASMAFSCGRNQPNALMSRFKLKFEDVVKVCLEADSLEFKQACIDALGFIVIKSSLNVADITLGCQKIGEPLYVARCARAAAGELVFQNTPGYKENAPKVCGSLLPEYQVDCQSYLNNITREYNR
jgi:hypothetical protein